MSLARERGKFIKERIREHLLIWNGRINTPEEFRNLYQLLGEIGDQGEDLSGQCVLNPIYREAADVYDKLHPPVAQRIKARSL